MAKARKVSLASAYLGQAAEALRATGSPETLYRGAIAKSGKFADAAARWLAPGNRLEYSRASILFSAVAAEAYVNHFIGEEFTGKDAEALDRLRTVDKYLFASKLVFGRDVFRRDRQPIQRLMELFVLRNELMHPKSVVPANPKSRRISAQVYETYNPEVAAKHLVNVAEAALELTTQRTVDDADWTALSVFAAKNLILRHGKEAKDTLPSLSARPVDPFEVQLVREERDEKTGRKVRISPNPKEVVPKLDRRRRRKR